MSVKELKALLAIATAREAEEAAAKAAAEKEAAAKAAAEKEAAAKPTPQGELHDILLVLQAIRHENAEFHKEMLSVLRKRKFADVEDDDSASTSSAITRRLSVESTDSTDSRTSTEVPSIDLLDKHPLFGQAWTLLGKTWRLKNPLPVKTNPANRHATVEDQIAEAESIYRGERTAPGRDGGKGYVKSRCYFTPCVTQKCPLGNPLCNGNDNPKHQVYVKREGTKFWVGCIRNCNSEKLLG